MGAQGFSERRLEKMGGGVVSHNCLTASLINLSENLVPHADGIALSESTVVENYALCGFCCICNCEYGAVNSNSTRISNLSAAFCIKCGFVKNDYRIRVNSDKINLFTVCGNGKNLAGLFRCAVAGELRCTTFLKGNVGTFPALCACNLAGGFCQSFCIRKIFFKFLVIDG